MNLDTLLQYTEEYKKEIFNLRWNDDDVRKAFFGLSYTVINDYYNNCTFLHTSKWISEGKISVSKELKPYLEHMTRLSDISTREYLTHTFLIGMEKQLFLNSWTAFETCIDLLFNHIVSSEEYEKIVIDLNKKLTKIYGKLETEEKETMMNILMKTSFIPLERKFRFLTKLNAENYQRNRNVDIDFLRFTTTLRNSTIHSNGIYKGNKEYQFTFSKETFDFVPNEYFKQSLTNKSVYLDIFDELKKLFIEVTKCIDYPDIISFPDEE